MRVLIASFKQETATFNPARTTRAMFDIHEGADLLDRLSGTRTEIAGALDVFRDRGGIEVVPTWSGASVSGGPVADADLDAMVDDLVGRVREQKDIDGAYIAFHGAMAGETEVDPEGRVLEQVRAILGDIPIVTSFDLHAVLTDRLVRDSDILVAFHTYPHIDQYETGQRAARNLLALLDGGVKPVIARVRIPMLVRGDELITATGRFGGAIRTCQEFEASRDGLAAAVLIGNPFTDVPDLRSNTLVITNNDAERARQVAESLARTMWNNRGHFVADLTDLDEALALARRTKGRTIFSDAADATSSGASGDGNAILRGLLESGYGRPALLPLVDPPAVDAAFEAGVGATVHVSLGGAVDPARHTPLACSAYVQSLHDGTYTMENGTAGNGGRTAVLRVDNCSVMVTTLPVEIMGRRVFESRGLNPEDFDLVVCKSPNGFRTYYAAIAERIVPVDVPGSTSANLKSLPYAHCPRPIFPLDTEADDAPPDLVAEVIVKD